MMELELETFGGDLEEYTIWRESFLAYQDASFQRVTETFPGPNVIKPFTAVIYKLLFRARVFEL
jgi:hypothetical protein